MGKRSSTTNDEGPNCNRSGLEQREMRQINLTRAIKLTELVPSACCGDHFFGADSHVPSGELMVF